MNRIYKVIWNKTRGMYMVVSELAKGQSKDGRRAVGRKKVAQTAAALAVFFSIVSAGGTSFAADGTTKVESSTSGTAVEVYTKNGTDAQIEAARKYTYRKAAELDTRITNVKEYLEQQTSDKYVSKADAAVQDGAIVKAANTIGENVTNLDAALAKETTDRKTADNELNERITNEANAIHETTKQLQTDLNTETTARETADAALDTRITNVKGYLEKQTSDNYVSKADAAVQDGAIVKAANTIGENVANLDAALDAEKNARIWADKTQDKVIQQVNQNMVDGFNTINKNMADGFTALNQADAKEAQERAAADAALDDKITAETSARVAADAKLVEAVNSGLSLSNDNVLQKNATTIDAHGNVTTSKTDANEMILNKGNDNRITLNEKGIKVGTNSTVVDKDGVYTGGDTYSEAKAAMSADGKIKGANGDFTVDENGNVTSKATITGETVTDGKGASMSNGTVTSKTLTDGIATITNGNINTSGTITGGTVTSTGNISAVGDIHAGGAITGASASIQGALTAGSATITGGLTAGGAIQGKSISDGTATMQNGNLTGVKNLSAETITTSGDATIGGDLTVKGKLNVDEIDLTKNGIVGDNNVTASTRVAAGEITSYKEATNTKGGSEKESSIDYDENGTSTWAKATDADGNWKKSTLTVEGSDVTSKVVDSDKNSNESKQTSTESSDVVKDGDGNTSTFRQKVDAILQEIKNAAGTESSSVDQKLDSITSTVTDGTNTTSVKQGTADITNTAEQGTISNIAKDLVNTATGNLTTTVGGNEIHTVSGTLTETVTGDVTEDYKANLSTTVGGNQTTTVTGDSSLTAENITNTAKNGTIANDAKDIINNAAENMTNTVGKDLTTTVGGEMKTTVTGKTTENYNGGLETTITGEEKHTVNGSQINAVTGDQTNTIGGSQTTTVTGDSSLSAQNITNTASETLSNSAKNITNTAAEKLSNSAAEIENTATKSIKDKVGENVSRTMTTSKIAESVVDGTKSNSSSKTADKDINIVTDGTSTSTLSQLAGSVNTSLKEVDGEGKTTKSLNNVQTVSEDTTKITDTASGSFSSSSQKADGFTSLVKNGSGGSNTVTDTATKSEQKLVSGNIIDILKDAENGYVNTTVSNSDGSSSTGVKQTYTDITSMAEQGTITHEAKDLVNEAAENITNTAGNRIQDKVGTTTVTTTDGLTKLTNEAGNHKTQMDYAEVLQDLSVGGNATVAGDVTAKSYKVGDKTYINENGINANGQKITNVADGTIAEGSTDAVNGGQLNATNQRVTTVENRMDGVENRMDRVENRVDNLDNRIDKVGASAAAMANLHPMDFDEDSKVSVAAAMGSYRSETAGALGVFYRPTDRVMLNVSTSFGNGENMVGGGVSFKLGKSSKRLEKAEATNAALAKQVTNLQNRLDALLGVLNPSLSKDFPDVPANHWAYEAVSRLAGNDIVQGYEDGKYHGERTMTRYEMAEIIYNVLSKGAKAEAKLVEEFRPELQAMAAQRKA